MFQWLTLSIVILVLLILIGIVFVVKVIRMKKAGTPYKPNYRALFFMGITFTGVGVAIATSTENPGLYGISVLGIIYMITGFVNRDKWGNGSEE